MTVYTFASVLVWDAPGGTVKLARRQSVAVLDPNTGLTAAGLTQDGQPVSQVITNDSGRVTFTATIPVVTLVAPRGFEQDVPSNDLWTNITVGSVPFAASGEVSTTKAVRADDSRLSDTRNPKAHTHAQADVTGLVTDLAARLTWKGPISSPTDLNTLRGDIQRVNYYEIQTATGMTNMPPGPFQGHLEVISSNNGRRIAQRMTYDDANGTVYLRRGVDTLGDGNFTWTSWVKLLVEADVSAMRSSVTTLTAQAVQPMANNGIVSSLVAGHGWTNGPTTNATFNLDDTTDSAVGDRCITITTNGTGNTGYVQKTSLALDLTDKGLVIWLKATNIASIRSVSVNIANNNSFTTGWFASLPVANGNKSPLSEGEWFPIYLPMGNAGVNNGVPTRTGVTAFRITLQDWNGLPAPTLKVGGLGTFPDKAPRYPKGVIALAFDDTYAAHSTVAAPKLATYGYPATEYLISSRVGTAGNLTMAQLNALREVYGWEIAAHASNDAAHVDWTTQTSGWIDTELAAQKAWNDANGFPTDTFAYPIGPFNSAIARQVRKQYASARSTYPWTNSAVRPHRHRLSCYAITSTVTLASAKVWVDRVVANGGFPVFMFHNLVASSPTGNDWLISDFNALVDYIAASGVPVDTVGNVIRNITT